MTNTPFEKIREQVSQFEELLALEYNMKVRLFVKVVTDDIVEDKIKTILETVSEYFAVPLFKLTSKGRKRQVIEARQIAYHFIFKIYKLTPTLNQTALIFGGQHHSTMIHGLRTVQDLLETDRHYATNYSILSNILESKIGTP